MNKVLDYVFRIHIRFTYSIESDTEYFSLQFYQKLIQDHALFDFPKLIDIASVYGKSNSEITKQLISSVFENDKKLIEEGRDAID